MSRILAVIPARGGSKRIPEKNIREFLGKPIIAYPISAAIESNIFDEVMVSTDSPRIAEVAKKYGARVPFMRSPETATDEATTASVLIEVLRNYHNVGKNFDYVACIYPAAVFTTPELLKKARVLIKKKEIDSVMTLTRYSHPIERAVHIVNDRVAVLNPRMFPLRTQELKASYHDAGQFYFFHVNELLQRGIMMSENTCPIILHESGVQDIDDNQDWILAEMKYSFINKKENNL